jgi:3-hydroxyacyl-[acyl-carrier-protein] dehydratase
MLQNELFTFIDLVDEGELVKANVKLDPSHPIFQGHFPGQPVLPGVIMVEIVKELLQGHIKKQTRLVKASDIKFLSVIIPELNNLIQVVLKINFVEDIIRVDAQLLDKAVSLFKFKGTFERML